MLVQKCLLYDEKPRTVKRFPRQSGVHFVLSFVFYFAKKKEKENDFFCFLVGRTGPWFQPHTCFALLAQVAALYSRRQCISFPVDLTVVQKGFSFCFG